ncbi:uncharacterized protein Dsimw501_GD28602 [Drosophila simulans]|nr:uncharacterized protein Dsimw501_GD28602 [Drosophila simulans]
MQLIFVVFAMVTLVGSLAPLAILNAANTTQLSLLLTKAVPASHLAISIPGPELEAIPDTLHANRRQSAEVAWNWDGRRLSSVRLDSAGSGWTRNICLPGWQVYKSFCHSIAADSNACASVRPSHAFNAISQQASENFAEGAPEARKSTAA